MANTGYKRYRRRLEVLLDASGNPDPNLPTGKSEPNTSLLPNGDQDPDWVPDVQDTTMCPIGGNALKLVHIDINGYDVPIEACQAVEVSGGFYFDGNGTYPANGDIIYINYAKEVFDGGDKYYKVIVANRRIQIDSNGIVSSDLACI